MAKDRPRYLTDALLVPVVKNVAPLRRLMLYTARAVAPSTRDWMRANYEVLRRQFIDNGSQSKFDSAYRAALVKRFEAIDQRVAIKTTPSDGLFLAEAMLSLDAEGEMVECGCFNGGSTAKLSILAKALGKQLHVFDSFAGLPAMDSYDRTDHHVRQSSSRSRTDWEEGMYAADLETVKGNVRAHGEISVCSFHQGWFAETLTPDRLPSRICFAFTDVDLASSARDCVTAIWPVLSPRAPFFSHDVSFLKVVDSLQSPDLWRDVLHEHPATLYGAGFGMGDGAPYLGFMVKGPGATPEYVKSLLIIK
jgi:hypothetical protein